MFYFNLKRDIFWSIHRPLQISILNLLFLCAKFSGMAAIAPKGIDWRTTDIHSIPKLNDKKKYSLKTFNAEALDSSI